MPEPITLAFVGGAALTEGIKFLYGQASEALKRWREHKEAAKTLAAVPATSDVPAIFAGDMKPLQFHLDKVGELEPQILSALPALSNYASGLMPVTTDNTPLLEQTDALRRLMEIVFQYRLTLQGEKRDASGPHAYGEADIENVRGHVAALKIGTLNSGTAEGHLKVKNVEAGSQAFGTEIDSMG